MAEGAAKAAATKFDGGEGDASQALTDGFHLIIDALKLIGSSYEKSVFRHNFSPCGVINDLNDMNDHQSEHKRSAYDVRRQPHLHQPMQINQRIDAAQRRRAFYRFAQSSAVFLVERSLFRPECSPRIVEHAVERLALRVLAQEIAEREESRNHLFSHY